MKFINWFKRASTDTKPVKIPIQDIKFEGVGTLHIPEDITPLEVAHLTVLLTFVTLPRDGCIYDFESYIIKYKLERMFK